ncbi:MAG: ferrous iron transport protein A [Clostridiales bacterium]|nr:ferrous iron transport protein A [Clostridiales bacterium]
MVITMTLDLLEPGQSGIIATIGGEGALRRRLLDMGLTPNTKVTVRKVAPMGDPIELYLRGYVLTLRKDDAVKITLKEENQG